MGISTSKGCGLCGQGEDQETHEIVEDGEGENNENVRAASKEGKVSLRLSTTALRSSTASGVSTRSSSKGMDMLIGVKDWALGTSTTVEPEVNDREPPTPTANFGRRISLNCAEANEGTELQRIEVLTDELYDVITAGNMIDGMEERSAKEESSEWGDFFNTETYRLYARRIKFFHAVGKACCSKDDTWFQVFRNANGTQTIHAMIDPVNAGGLQYRVRAVIPVKLTAALLVANEVQFMPEWNKLVTQQPNVIGRRTAHYMVLNYQMSVLAGMFKVDVLSEIRRFTNVEGGFMAEYIESVEEGCEGYVDPAPGFKRPQTKLANVWAACGPDHTVLIQVGALKLPFSVNQWVVSKVGAIAGNKIIGGLVKNSLLAKEPGNMWESALQEDKYGLYERLDQCVASAASTKRTPTTEDVVDDFDLAAFFEKPVPRAVDFLKSEAGVPAPGAVPMATRRSMKSEIDIEAPAEPFSPFKNKKAWGGGEPGSPKRNKAKEPGSPKKPFRPFG